VDDVKKPTEIKKAGIKSGNPQRNLNEKRKEVNFLCVHFIFSKKQKQLKNQPALL